VQSLLAEMVNLRDAGGASEDLVGPALVPELRRIGFARLLRSEGILLLAEKGLNWTHKLNRDCLGVEQVCSLEDDAERALADFLSDAIVNADYIIRV